MTPRERVRRSLEFERPDRVPRDLWVLPAAAKRLGPAALDAFRARWPADIVQAGAGLPSPRRGAGTSHQLGDYTDEWGCTFVSLVDGILGEVKTPLIDDYARLDDVLRVPEELLAVDAGAVGGWCRAEERFVLAPGWPRPFERLQFLRGTEELLMDIAEESDGFRELLRRVHDFYRRQLEVWARTAVDGLAVMDDWGSQQSLLISPAVWRRLFKPLYAEYARIARDHGKKLFFHSDGHIAAIYPDLVEIGVDALNSQLFCMDLAELARMAKGRLTFWGEIDRQQVLPSGSPDAVEAAVDRVADALWSPEGGCIAQFELTPETPLANAEAVYRAWARRTATRSRAEPAYRRPGR